MSKTRVLFFIDRMRHGGIQQFAVEIVKNMDPNKCQIEILLLDDGQTYPLENVLKELGVKFYKLKGIWFQTPLDIFKQKKALEGFFKEHHDYKVVHMHSSSKNFMVLKMAKKYGIPVRIAHSHNIGFQSKNKIKIMIGNVFKRPLRKYATHYFACSKLAGKWLFGDKEVKIIHNAVDYEKFKFDPIARARIRTELGIEQSLVIGNVGRFTNQKNHTFLIDIFKQIKEQNEKAVLMLVGIGEKEQEIRDKVERLGLTDCVKFMGFCNNTNELFREYGCIFDAEFV